MDWEDGKGKVGLGNVVMNTKGAEGQERKCEEQD